MGKVIAIANQKGGVGKTTTSINLSAALAAKNKKILVIDTDPQGNTTSGFGVDKNNLDNTIYELFLGECSIQECVIKDVVKGVSLIPSNVNLAATEIELIGVDKKEFILRNEVDWIKDQYDYIIIFAKIISAFYTNFIIYFVIKSHIFSYNHIFMIILRFYIIYICIFSYYYYSYHANPVCLQQFSFPASLSHLHIRTDFFKSPGLDCYFV